MFVSNLFYELNYYLADGCTDKQKDIVWRLMGFRFTFVRKPKK